MPPKRRTLEDRIQDKYIAGEPDECWLWSGAKTSAGYGHMLADGEVDGKRKTMLAHRALYTLLVGVIPEGAVLDHTCHNKDLTCPGNAACLHRACVNPVHLEPVSFGENCLRGRGISAKNAAKDHCNSGHPYLNNVKLDSNGVRECQKCKRRRAELWIERNPNYVSPINKKRRAERAARLDLH